MTQTMKEYQLVISSEPVNISKVEPFLEQVCNELSVPEEIYGNVLISVTEAVNNGIVHGNNTDKSKNVTVFATYNGKLLSFKIADQGNGFDFNNIPDPTSPENIEKTTGRGIFLMKQLSEYVIFSNNGNTVEIQFKV